MFICVFVRALLVRMTDLELYQRMLREINEGGSPYLCNIYYYTGAGTKNLVKDIHNLLSLKEAFINHPEFRSFEKIAWLNNYPNSKQPRIDVLEKAIELEQNKQNENTC
jgi:hypothetical protein